MQVCLLPKCTEMQPHSTEMYRNTQKCSWPKYQNTRKCTKVQPKTTDVFRRATKCSCASNQNEVRNYQNIQKYTEMQLFPILSCIKVPWNAATYNWIFVLSTTAFGYILVHFGSLWLHFGTFLCISVLGTTTYRCSLIHFYSRCLKICALQYLW